MEELEKQKMMQSFNIWAAFMGTLVIGMLIGSLTANQASAQTQTVYLPPPSTRTEVCVNASGIGGLIYYWTYNLPYNSSFPTNSYKFIAKHTLDTYYTTHNNTSPVNLTVYHITC